MVETLRPGHPAIGRVDYEDEDENDWEGFAQPTPALPLWQATVSLSGMFKLFKLAMGILIGLVLAAAGWWYYSDGGRKDPVQGFEDAVKYQGQKAVHAVEKEVTNGVEGLKDNLDKTGARIGQEVNDATVLAKVKAKLIREKSLDGFKINVDVDKGIVNLTGTVPTLDARTLAIKLARETEGVKDIHADLKLQTGGTN